jgi:hypothetical protein
MCAVAMCQRRVHIEGGRQRALRPRRVQRKLQSCAFRPVCLRPALAEGAGSVGGIWAQDDACQPAERSREALQVPVHVSAGNTQVLISPHTLDRDRRSCVMDPLLAHCSFSCKGVLRQAGLCASPSTKHACVLLGSLTACRVWQGACLGNARHHTVPPG